MSTPPRRPSKTVNKRRAATRRRTREIGRHLFAYFIIGLLVLGTVSTIFVAQAPVANAPVVELTPTQSSELDILVTRADEAAAKGEWAGAISFYSAYLSQNPGNATVNFKLGKAYASSTPPDNTKASQYLQEAIRLSPGASFEQEAKSLLAEVSSKITPGATTSVPVTGTLTSPITGTITLTGTGTPPVATTVVTGTVGATATGTSPITTTPSSP